MKKILIQAMPHGDSFKLSIPSEYNRHRVKHLVRSGKVTLFELIPRVRASKAQQGYLEGAIIPAYGLWQYGLDPRRPETAKTARDLFKMDFHYAVVKDRSGNPTKVAQSLKGAHKEVLDKYSELAPENGMPLPNEKLYKLWKDQYSMDLAWSNYWDWLDYLELESDSMPSREYLSERL